MGYFSVALCIIVLNKSLNFKNIKYIITDIAGFRPNYLLSFCCYSISGILHLIRTVDHKYIFSLSVYCKVGTIVNYVNVILTVSNIFVRLLFHSYRYSYPEQCKGPVDAAGLPAPEAL